MRPDQYIIVLGDSAKGLVGVVNDKIRDGYWPCGGLVLVTGNGETVVVAQAMMLKQTTGGEP